MPDWLSIDTERAAALLEAHPDYRVLRSLPPLNLLPLPEPEGKLRKAVVLDTETTSLDPATGRIIELALCQITFDGRGRIVEIGLIYDWLEDPGFTLPADIVTLTGLSDADVAGRRIDDEAALRILSEADLLVAHHVAFDAKWVEQRYPALAGMPWCCSLNDLDWKAFGYESRQLGGLLAEVAGFFNRRHRADADVSALIALLAARLSSGRTACSEMILRAQRPTALIVAEAAPFEFKDRLKARRYRWNPQLRYWWREVALQAVDEELAWLATEADCHFPSVREITWRQRHRI